jgi:hypothetical protein
MPALWMITFVAADRHGAKGVEALRAQGADVNGPIVLGPGKFDCLDRTVSLRMVSGCRARQFARLHIPMLMTMAGAERPRRARKRGRGAKVRRTP